MSAPSLPQLAATLALLLVKHPEVAGLPVQVELRERIEFAVAYGSPDAARAAAALGKALRAKAQSYPAGEHVYHTVAGKFAGVPVEFRGFQSNDHAGAGESE